MKKIILPKCREKKKKKKNSLTKQSAPLDLFVAAL